MKDKKCWQNVEKGLFVYTAGYVKCCGYYQKSMGVSQKTKNKTTTGSTIPSTEYTHKNNTFIVSLLIIVNLWDQPKTGS